MFQTGTNLGPAVPFFGFMIGGMLTAFIFTALAARRTAARKKDSGLTGRAIGRFFLWAGSFVLWGSVFGTSSEMVDGGTVGFTRGGLLGYATVTSRQISGSAGWAHEFAINPLPFFATVTLSFLLLIIALVIMRRQQFMVQL